MCCDRYIYTTFCFPPSCDFSSVFLQLSTPSPFPCKRRPTQPHRSIFTAPEKEPTMPGRRFSRTGWVLCAIPSRADSRRPVCVWRSFDDVGEDSAKPTSLDGMAVLFSWPARPVFSTPYRATHRTDRKEKSLYFLNPNLAMQRRTENRPTNRSCFYSPNTPSETKKGFTV